MIYTIAVLVTIVTIEFCISSVGHSVCGLLRNYGGAYVFVCTNWVGGDDRNGHRSACSLCVCGGGRGVEDV